MESSKRHSLLSLIFILNFFSKTSVIRNVKLYSYYRVKIFRSLFFFFVIPSFFFFFLWMRVRRGSRVTFGAGHLMPSIFVLFWFKIGYKTVLILDMIHSSWLHLGRPDMKHYPLTRMWRLVTSPTRYSMLPSIRTVSVSGHLKQKLNFLRRPFQLSVNEVFRMKAKHFSFNMKVLASWKLAKQSQKTPFCSGE